MKWFYNMMYRYSFVPIPYDIGPREELVNVVESGRVKPCRAIDLGSGTASNVIYLAKHGFEVTGVDYSPAAIELGRKRASEAGVEVTFIEDDLTNLQHIKTSFDFLVDYGTLDDLRTPQRGLYVQNVMTLVHPGSLFLIFCFEWPARWWERPLSNRVGVAMRPGEIEHRFSDNFEIENFRRVQTGSRLIPAFVTYLMTRREEVMFTDPNGTYNEPASG
jgi:SAM-dependent methyltransferase